MSLVIFSNNNEYDDKKSVEAELKNLHKTILKNRRIGSLHGKLNSAVKEKILTDFNMGKIDVLVSTSVVEVGIDIKNATAMIIEDAQMFGLSQLHQLRGRVGRSDKKSFCFIFAKIEEGSVTKNRLKAFVQNDDGFELSSYDLKLRGPGSFFNVNQSGFSGINPLWFENSQLLKDCSEAANQVLPQINHYPRLNEIISDKMMVKHLD